MFSGFAWFLLFFFFFQIEDWSSKTLFVEILHHVSQVFLNTPTWPRRNVFGKDEIEENPSHGLQWLRPTWGQVVAVDFTLFVILCLSLPFNSNPRMLGWLVCWELPWQDVPGLSRRLKLTLEPCHRTLSSKMSVRCQHTPDTFPFRLPGPNIWPSPQQIAVGNSSDCSGQGVLMNKREKEWLWCLPPKHDYPILLYTLEPVAHWMTRCLSKLCRFGLNKSLEVRILPVLRWCIFPICFLLYGLDFLPQSS